MDARTASQLARLNRLKDEADVLPAGTKARKHVEAEIDALHDQYLDDKDRAGE